MVISDVELMKKALVEKAEYFSDRPTHLVLLKYIFQETGEYTWRSSIRLPKPDEYTRSLVLLKYVVGPG